MSGFDDNVNPYESPREPPPEYVREDRPVYPGVKPGTLVWAFLLMVVMLFFFLLVT